MSFTERWIDLAQSWWPVMVSMALQAAIVSAIACLLVRRLRRLSSPLHYAILCLALVKFAVPPTWSSPTGLWTHTSSWLGRPWIDGDTRTADRIEPTGASARRPPRVETGKPDSSSSGGEPTPVMSSKGESPAHTEEALTGRALVDKPRNDHDAGLQRRPDPAASTAGPASLDELPAIAWAFALHVLGSVLAALVAFVLWVRLHRVARRGRPVRDAAVLGRFESICRRLRLRRRPRLLASSFASSPIAFGVMRPAVLVPEAMLDSLSPGELEMVFEHELTHHRHGDLWVSGFQLLLSIAWWFHPMIWMLNRKIRQAREDWCDDAVLAARPRTESQYCQTLLRVAASAHSKPPRASIAMATSLGSLERRFRRLFDPGSQRRSRLSPVAALALLAFAAVLLPGWTAQEERPARLPEQSVEQPARDSDDRVKPLWEEYFFSRDRSKYFVLLGRFPAPHDREELALEIEAMGAQVSEEVGPETDYLVLGEVVDPTQTEAYQKAQRYGVLILTPDDAVRFASEQPAGRSEDSVASRLGFASGRRHRAQEEESAGQPGAMKVRAFQLEHADARKMVSALELLIEENPELDVSKGLRLTARGSTIFARGSEGQLQTLADLIEKLDVKGKELPREYPDVSLFISEAANPDEIRSISRDLGIDAHLVPRPGLLRVEGAPAQREAIRSIVWSAPSLNLEREPWEDDTAYRMTYEVQPGDTLASISKQFFGTTENASFIAQVNGLDFRRLEVGQELEIPVPEDAPVVWAIELENAEFVWGSPDLDPLEVAAKRMNVMVARPGKHQEASGPFSARELRVESGRIEATLWIDLYGSRARVPLGIHSKRDEGYVRVELGDQSSQDVPKIVAQVESLVFTTREGKVVLTVREGRLVSRAGKR